MLAGYGCHVDILKALEEVVTVGGCKRGTVGLVSEWGGVVELVKIVGEVEACGWLKVLMRCEGVWREEESFFWRQCKKEEGRIW